MGAIALFLVGAGVIAAIFAGGLGFGGLMLLGRTARARGWVKDGDLSVPTRPGKTPQDEKDKATEARRVEKARIRKLQEDLAGLLVTLGYTKVDSMKFALDVVLDGGPQDSRSLVSRALARIEQKVL